MILKVIEEILYTLIGIHFLVYEKLEKRKRNKLLKQIYPLELKILKPREKEILSSLYGTNGYYYRVIKSGKITKEQSEAINAKIKRELQKRK
ncbi:hypothetical protein J7E43_05630 [Bacillus sp. ISL-8]|nr:hypothetical protein [Bacillus sp. ISL-8]